MDKGYFPQSIDTTTLQNMLDDFQDATDVQVILVSSVGDYVLQGQRDTVCDVFHFDNPAGNSFLREWAEEMSVKGESEKTAEPLCPFGYPLVCHAIQTHRGPMGMLVACGFTFEKPDSKHVRRTADRYGFDHSAYGKAIDRMPILTKDRFRRMKSMFRLLCRAIERAINADLTIEDRNVKLEETGRFYHSLLEYNHAIILIINPNNGRIVDASLGAAEFYGYPMETLRTMRFSQVNFSSEDEMIEAIRSVNGNNVRSFPSVNKVADGQTRSVNIFLTSITLDGHIYLFCIVQDITRQKEFEKEMRKAREKLYHVQKLEAMEALASGIAHDFNNILSSIMGYAELARLNPDRKNYIQSILESGDKARELVRQILTFSRQVELNPQPLNLSELIGKTIKQFRKNITSEVKLAVVTEGKIPSVFADPAQIQQLLINLLENSCQAMDTEGMLTLRLTTTGEKKRQVRLIISDTGCGIPEDTITRVFDPFFTTSDQDDRSGLGLAIVYGIVKDLKGTIEIESEVGKGTTVTIDLPSSEGGEKPEMPVPIVPINGDGEKLLLVDDEESILAIGKLMLESFNYQLVAYQNPLQAMEYIREHGATIDAVLLDYAMPDMDGVQLVKELREYHSNLPVFIITAYYEELPNLKGIANAVIEKPIDWAAISQLLHKTLHPE